MKKLMILMGVVVLSSTCFAQFEYGVKVGANASYVINSGFNTKPGLAAGAFVNYRLNKTFSFGTELLYSQQGVQIRDNGYFWDSNSTAYAYADYYKAYKLNYLNIPVISKVNVYKGLFLEVGFQMGILLNGSYVLDVDGLDENNKTEDLSKYKDLNNLDVGMNFGLGYEHKSGFLVDVRYNPGFSKVFLDEDQNYLNSVWQATVGYRFGKTKTEKGKE